MNCKNCKKLILEMLSDESNFSHSKALSSHLKECQHCSSEFREFKSLLHKLESAEIEEPKKDYWDNSYKSIIRKTQALKKEKVGTFTKFLNSFDLRPQALALASFLVIAVLAFALFNKTDEDYLSMNIYESDLAMGGTQSIYPDSTELEQLEDYYLYEAIGGDNLTDEEIDSIEEHLSYASYQNDITLEAYDEDLAALNENEFKNFIETIQSI